MRKHRRGFGGSASIAVFASLALAGVSTLAGCTGLKQAVGLQPTAPNEFEVESQAPLTIPPDFALRPPKPGEKRPQGTSPTAQAREAMEQAGPGKPVKEAAQHVYSGGPAGVSHLGGGPAAASGQIGNPNAQIAAGSLSQKLLDYTGAVGIGATVDKRETTPLEGVH